jgi:hypothetical protein
MPSADIQMPKKSEAPITKFGFEYSLLLAICYLNLEISTGGGPCTFPTG